MNFFVMLVLRRDSDAHPRMNAALISRRHLMFERKGGAAACWNKDVVVAWRLWNQAAIDHAGALGGRNGIARCDIQKVNEPSAKSLDLGERMRFPA